MKWKKSLSRRVKEWLNIIYMLTLLKRNKRTHFRRKSKKENRLTKRRRWDDGFTGAEVKLCFFQRLLLLEGKVIRRDWCVRLCLYKQWNYLIIMRCGINMHALSFFFFFKVLYSLKFWWGSYNFDSYFKNNSSFDFKILSITITLDYI